MNLLKNFAEKNNGNYKEETIKEAFTSIGKMIYQPKSARFLVGGSKISVNLNEVGGAIPTAEPFRITLHLKNECGKSLEIYPVSIWERILQKFFPSKRITIKEQYVFKSDKELIKKIIEEDSIFGKLKGHRIYIRIPKENSSRIILTPERGIEKRSTV